MKRKHIYVGGTVLLTLLGALGGYFLWAGGDENPERSQADQKEQPAGPDETLPIEVPPIGADDFVVPEMPEMESPPVRYARGGSPLEGAGGYSPPTPGGASALPVNMRPVEQPGMDNLPAGEASSVSDTYPTSVETNEPVGATAREAFDTSEQYNDLITRGQEPSSIEAAATELANPLREEARAAFSPEGDEVDAAAPVETGRYGAEDSLGSIPNGNSAYEVAAAAPAEHSEEDPLDRSFASNPHENLQPAGQTPPAGLEVTAAAPMTLGSVGAAMPVDSPSSTEQTEADFATDAADARGGYAAPSPAAVGEGHEYSYQGVSQPGTAREGSFASPPVAATDPPPQDFQDAYGGAAGTVHSPVNTGAAGMAAAGGAGTGRPGDSTLEGLQSPELAIEKTAPAEIQVGKECTFSVVVRNVGEVPARDVRLVDEIPLGTQLTGTSPRATVLGSQLEWELGSLAPGEERKVDIQLVPTDEGEIGSVATVQFAAAASARARCTRPLLEIEAEVPATVMIGEQQVVRITLRNPGSGDATGIMLLENVPQGMTHPHGRDLEFEVGTLRAGETRQLELVLTAEHKGIVQNRITAKGDGNLFAEDITQFEVVAPAIAVSVEGPQRKYLELPATFVVAIENPGTAAANDIELVGKLPAGLEFVSADNFGQYDAETRSVYWSLAELPPRERGEVKLVAMPKELGEQRIQVQADARLGLADHAESTLQVEGLAAIKFEVTDIADPVEVGGETSYEIRVVNQGSKPATNVQVLARFPEGVAAIRAEGPTSTPRVEPGLVTFAPLEKLSPKADATFRIDARGVQSGDQRIVVTISTDDLAAPITEEESTRVYADR